MQEQTSQPQSQFPSQENPKAEKKNKRGATANEQPQSQFPSQENPKADEDDEVTAAGDDAGPGLFFGNLDTEKRFKLPADWRKHVCVYQCQIMVINRGVVEVPNTHMLQTYTPEQFDKNSDDSKGVSFFSENKMQVIVLHDPRRK